MELKKITYARTSLLKFKHNEKIINDDLIKSTNKIIEQILTKPGKMNLITLNDHCKKIDLSLFEKIYTSSLANIKNEILKISKNKNVKKCIKYNNPNFYKLAYFKKASSTKKENNQIKSLYSYISRMTFNPTYGGLYGFASLITDRLNRELKLNIIEEDNKHISPRITTNTKYFLSASVTTQGSEVVVFSHKDNAEKIFKISNEKFTHLLKFLINNKTKINYKEFLSLKLVNSKTQYNELIKKLTEIDIISHNKANTNSFFPKRSDKKVFDYDSFHESDIKNDCLYDLINTNGIPTLNISDNKINHIANSYLSLIEKQLSHIKKEKNEIKNLIKCHLKRENKKTCNLLTLIAENIEKINKIREKRSIFDEYFIKRINSSTQPITTLKQPNEEKRNNMEMFLSSCVIDYSTFYVVNGISPAGVFSSRFDYIFSKKTKMPKTNNEPIEVLFNNFNKALYHSSRRLKYSAWKLNINSLANKKDKHLININEIDITIDKNNCPVLYSKKYNKFFEPIIHSTSPADQSLILIFLKMISNTQEEIFKLPEIALAKTEKIEHAQRIILDDIIISKSKWTIPTKLINVIKDSAPKYNEYLFLMKLFKEHNIPRYINISSNDGPRPVDIYNPYSILQFKKYLNQEHITIEEMLPSPQNTNKKDEQLERFVQYLCKI